MGKRNRKKLRESRGHQSQVKSFKMVYFFLPLPVPLRIPDGHTIRITVPSDPLEEDDTIIDALYDDEIGHHGLATSIRIHQVESEQPHVNLSAAFEAAARAFPPGGPFEGTETSNSEQAITTTVIEAATRLQSTSEESMTEAFDRVVTGLQSLQRSYVVATNHLMPLISLAQMPFCVPYAIRRVTSSENEPSWPTDGGLFLTNLYDSYLERQSYSEDSIDEAALDAMSTLGDLDSSPFISFVDNWREARLAERNRTGSVACILAATSAELLLREVLTMLLWEEGIAPRAAAVQLCGKSTGSRTISSLLATEFHERLGGSWDRNGDGVIARYMKLVIQIRNRIVHSGYDPSTDDVQAAIETCRELVDFLHQRLIKRVERYPLTTLMTAGYGELYDRNLGDYLGRLLSEAIVPQDIDENYMSYRFEVDRYSNDRHLRNGGELSASLENAHVALLIFSTGKMQWWLVDPDARIGCLARAPRLNRKMRRTVDKVRHSTIADRPFHGACSVRIEASTVPLMDPPIWYLMHEVWPLVRVDRFPSCPIPIYEECRSTA